MGIVLEIPDLEPVVGSTRERYDWTAAAGFPPHVTLVGGTSFEGPSNEHFLQRADELGAAIARRSTLSLRFARLKRYPGALVIEVEPNAGLLALTADVSEIVGAECRTTFHVTLARASEPELRDVQRVIAPHLPMALRAHRVSVIGGDGAGGQLGVLASWDLAR